MAPATSFGPIARGYLCFHVLASLYVARALQLISPSLQSRQQIRLDTERPEMLSTGVSFDDGLQSYDKTEWDSLMSHLDQVPDANASDANPSEATTGICFGNWSVPQVYVLGAQKAGSSTLAYDLLTAGLHSGAKDGRTKELHRFDGHCSWRLEPGRTEKDWAGESCSGTCRKFTKDEKDKFASSFNHSCSPIQYADMTPLNLRLLGLPKVMADLYGAKAHDLKFIIGLRDPVQRLHSGYYHESKFDNYASFTEYVDMLRATVPEYKKNHTIGCNYRVDQFYRSLYSRNIEPWLDQFAPDRFAIIPMSLYFRKAKIRQALLDTVSRHLNISSIHPKRVKVATAVNAHPDYPSLEDDLSADRIEWLRKHYFRPDTKKLAKMLARAVGNGLVIAGYGGPAKSSHIFNYLWENW